MKLNYKVKTVKAKLYWKRLSDRTHIVMSYTEQTKGNQNLTCDWDPLGKEQVS